MSVVHFENTLGSTCAQPHLRALLRCVWQAPASPPIHHMQGGELDEQDAEAVDVSRQRAPLAHQLLGGCRRVQGRGAEMKQKWIAAPGMTQEKEAIGA